MRQLLLCLILLCPAALRAEVIYTGPTDIDWSNTVAIGADKFMALNVADEIVFNITYQEGQEWPQVAPYDGWWQALPGAGSVAISAATTQVVYYATTAMIATLQERGMIVSGCGYTLNSAEIIATESDDDMSAAIWIGNEVFDSSWSNYTSLPASCFTDAKEGDYLRFHYKDLGAGAYLSVRNSSWEDLADAPGVTAEGTYTRYEITAAMLSELQAGGAIVMGTSFTLTYVDLANPLDTPVLTGSVSVTNNWIYEGGTTPYVEVKVTNGTDSDVTADVALVITTDKYEAVTTLTTAAAVPAGKVVTVPFTFDLDPGFYRLTATVNDELARAFVIGVEPESIVSAPDAQDDFASFWQAAKDELATIDINATLTRLDDKSTSSRDVYLVEFYSIPDGEGEPVVIRGYYAEPVAEGKYPTILHYQGYDNGTLALWCMGGNDLPGYCELILSTRGQLINNRDPYVNTYGDWFQYNFGNKDAYYYRGAYMDLLRAVDFVCSREKVDSDNLFAEGQSQGGAFTYAATALSDHPFRAVAPAIPFMGDFPDYFDLASWPANVARQQQAALGMSDEEMYTFLSYFDTKNLATLVPATTAVIETIGLADTTCPPHTNMAPYNNLAAGIEKQISYNPLLGHEVPSNWYNTYMSFFENHLTTSGITSAPTAGDPTAGTSSSARYTLSGQKVGDDYKGVVVENGKKYLAR